MAKRKKPRVIETGERPNPSQLRNGNWERDFVTHVDTNTKAMVHKRRDSSIVLSWITAEDRAVADGEMPIEQRLFPLAAQRFMGDCITLWSKVGTQRLTAKYGERMPSSGHHWGMCEKEALDQLHRWRELLGCYHKHYWGVFEAVLRHNEPAGVAGSAFAKNDAQRIQSAKLIVSHVATTLADRLRY